VTTDASAEKPRRKVRPTKPRESDDDHAQVMKAAQVKEVDRRLMDNPAMPPFLWAIVRTFRLALVDKKLARNFAVQLVFIGLAATIVFGFVSAARKDQMRARCSATCSMGPTYAGRNRTAPDFTLTDLDGKSVSLSSFKGKTVVMNFWNSTCQPCMEEMPNLARLALALQGRKDVVFFTVNTDDAEDEDAMRDALRGALLDDPAVDSNIRDMVKGGKLPFMVLRDASLAVTRDIYGTTKVPETWIIDPDGFIRARFDGAREWDSGAARKAIDSVSQGAGCLVEFDKGKSTGQFSSLCDPE